MHLLCRYVSDSYMHKLHPPRPSLNRGADSETSLSPLSSLGEASVYGRRSAHWETISELSDLLEALDGARAAVGAQLAAHNAEMMRRKRCVLCV